MSTRDVGTWILIGALLPLAWTSVLLHLRTPWWKTEMGRHLLVYSVALATVFTFGMAFKITQGETAWVESLRVGTYVLLVVALAQRVWLQTKHLRPQRD